MVGAPQSSERKIVILSRFVAKDLAFACDLPSSGGNFLTHPSGRHRIRKDGIQTVNYVVVFEKSATGWAAYVPDLPGVVTTGSSKEETQKLIREAIQFHIEGLKEDNLPIPEPTSSAELISVPST
jgi:predicted RNase H-like HicB family nuclease